MEAFGTHGAGRADENGRDAADAGISREENGPDGSHDHDEEHGGLGLTEPEQGQRRPTNAGKRLQPEGEEADGVFGEFEARVKQAERQPQGKTDRVTEQQAFQGQMLAS